MRQKHRNRYRPLLTCARLAALLDRYMALYPEGSTDGGMLCG
jgi:hypothetical protein